MKKIFALGWMLVAALALTNCSKEETVTPEMEGQAFEIFANANSSRTTMADLKTSWEDGDAMNVWTATTEGYQSHGQFTISDVENGKFTGTLDASFDPKTANDWYVMYPYNSSIKLPDGSNYMYVGHTAPKQNGNDSQAHLSGSSAPLYGVAEAVAGSETPVFQMHHLSTFVRVRVTNNTAKPFSVASVYMTSESGLYLVGSYYVNITGDEGDEVVYTPSGDPYTKTEVTLTVNNGEEIAVGKQAEFYLPLAPIQFGQADEMLTVDITTTEGATISVEKTIPAGTKFAAGVMNTLKVEATEDNIEYPEVADPYEIPFEDDFSWLSTAELTNTTSGQFDMSQKAEYASSAYTYYDEVNGIKLGTGDYRGSFTTNPFNLSQNFTVVVTAMTYNTDASTIDVTVGDVTKSYTLYANKYITYAFPFDAVAEPAQVTVTINGKRGYIKDFAIQTSSYEAQPTIVITSGDIIAEAKGITDGVITYDIINALDDTSVVATTDAEDWIHFGVPADGQLTYSIDEGTETRNATITLSYGTANDAIAVTQTKPSNATDVTFNFPQLSLTNAAEILDPITQGPITLQFAAGSYSSSAKYYTSGSAIRFYAGNTVTISGGNIIKILVSYSSASYAKTTACDSGEFTVSGAQGTWMGSAESVTLTNSSTAQQRITQITVYYE